MQQTNYTEKRKQLLPLLNRFLSKKRVDHSLHVEQAAVQLAKAYKIPEHKAAEAGLMHDIAKEMDVYALAQTYNIPIFAEKTLHGPVGACWLQEEGVISNTSILSAIHYHTTGRGHMTTLEMIVYLADLIEPGRNFNGVEQLRVLAQQDLSSAMLYSLKLSIKHLVETDKLIEPASIEAYNYFRREADLIHP